MRCMRAGLQFAPTYHEYVLYSDGSQDAPVQAGQGLEMVKRSSIVSLTEAAAATWTRKEPPHVTSAAATQHEARLAAAAASGANSRASGSRARPPVRASDGDITSFADTDFNPRAAPYRQWGKSFEGAPRGSDTRRDSSCDNDATELTKLTDRRASEHGPLLDTIDIRGENEEYSEGFIQR